VLGGIGNLTARYSAGSCSGSSRPTPRVLGRALDDHCHLQRSHRDSCLQTVRAPRRAGAGGPVSNQASSRAKAPNKGSSTLSSGVRPTAATAASTSARLGIPSRSSSSPSPIPGGASKGRSRSSSTTARIDNDTRSTCRSTSCSPWA
jgi:hypothetical protein